MVAKKIKSSQVDRSDSKNYIKRSMELRESMRNNLILENWNAALIDAVHAVISANDAVTVAFAGLRSTSTQHLDAALLLEQSVPKSLKPELSRLRRIISIKSHVEYGPSLATETDTKKVAKDAERFVDWAENTIKRLQ